MTENEKNILLQMHQFYSQEARHQRSMMWETVKWFTPVLTILAGIWIKYFIDKFIPCSNSNFAWLLIALSIGGICLSAICILLLRSFYRTNLIYITMFAKVEEELGFDTRKKLPVTYFSGDEYIIWEDYRYYRMGKEPTKDEDESSKFTSKKYIKDKFNDKLIPFKDTSI